MQSTKRISSEQLISQYGRYYEIVSPPNRYMTSEHDHEWYHDAPHSVYIQEHLGGLEKDGTYIKRNYEDAVLAFNYFVKDELEKTLASMNRNERTLDAYYIKALKKIGLLSKDKSEAVDKIQSRLKEVRASIGKEYPPIVKKLDDYYVVPSHYPKVGEHYYLVETLLTSKLQITKLNVLKSSIGQTRDFIFYPQNKGIKKHKAYDYWFDIVFEDEKGNKIKLEPSSLLNFNGYYYIDPNQTRLYFKSYEEAKVFLLGHIRMKQGEIDDFIKEG